MEPSSHELAVPIERMTLRQKLALYARTITTHPARLPLEQLVFLVASWVPTAVGVGLRSLLYPLVVRSQWPLIVEKNVTLHRPGAITLGRNVFLGENVYLLAGGRGIAIGDYSEILPNVVLMIRDYRGVPNAGIEIGSHVGINTGAIIFSHGSTRIGDDVLIGPGAVISTSGHTFEDGTRPIRMQRIAVGDIEIGAGAWIGARAVVLPGIRVGEGAVIGAGAVVSSDIPPRSLAVGVPARVVRSWGRGERPPEAQPATG